MPIDYSRVKYWPLSPQGAKRLTPFDSLYYRKLSLRNLSKTH